VLGVGAGWNREEIENHGVEFSTRWRRVLEHLAAMKTIWQEDEATFSGQWVTFDRIWSWPKPVQRPHPPILLGTMKPSGLVLRHADGWLPLSAAHPGDLGQCITTLKANAKEAGRDPGSLDVTVLCLEPTTPERVQEYAELGATRVLLRAPTDTAERFESFIDRYRLIFNPRCAPAAAPE
jgi:alkanesulfonate monooxygenase SsuD/methylene tetrahydromethanopterin reductase-like flavin-dependent oxidoreductase (luciferase family)